MNQQVHYTRRGNADYVRISERQCPLCNAFLIRTPRRPVDRLWSLFKPVLRYRCQRFACQWHGNLPPRAAKDGVAGDDQSGDVQRTIPMAFIAHIVLAVVGTTLVVVIGNSEPLVLLDAFSPEPGDKQETRTTVAQEDLPVSRQTRRTVAEPEQAAPTITIRPASRY